MADSLVVGVVSTRTGDHAPIGTYCEAGARLAAEEINARTLIVSGGVAANQGLRRAAIEERVPFPVLFPSPGLATDNAAMIAAAAFAKFERGQFSGFDLRASAGLTLAP